MWMGHRLVLNEIKSTSNAKTVPLKVFLTNFEGFLPNFKGCKFAPKTSHTLLVSEAYLIINFRILKN